MTKFQRHLLLHELRLGPGQDWMEADPGWLFLRLNRGRAYWLGKGTANEVAPGHVLLAPPQAGGELRASRLGEAHIHYFRFCPELATDFLTLSEENFLDQAAEKVAENVRIVPCTDPLAQAFTLLVDEGETGNTFAPRAQMLRIAALAFAPEMVSQESGREPSGSVEQRFKKLFQQMPEKELARFSPDELAELCECSIRHFSRLFRKHFGTTIRTRQTELRLLRARQLLLETDAKITAVATESGYQHLGLFHVMFKKYVGMTPSEWRKTGGRKAKAARARASLEPVAPAFVRSGPATETSIAEGEV